MCLHTQYVDTDFPDVDRCQGNTQVVRVHGCMWCGQCKPPHAAWECPRKNEVFPPGEVQMTMATELQLGTTLPKADNDEEARVKDKAIWTDMQARGRGPGN